MKKFLRIFKLQVIQKKSILPEILKLTATRFNRLNPLRSAELQKIPKLSEKLVISVVPELGFSSIFQSKSSIISMLLAIIPELSEIPKLPEKI